MRTKGLGLFLQEVKRHMEKLQDNNTATQGHQQREIAAFFSPITPTHATSQANTAQAGSQSGHCKGVTIDRLISICYACRPQLSQA